MYYCQTKLFLPSDHRSGWCFFAAFIIFINMDKKERDRLYYLKNKEKIKERVRLHYNANSDKINTKRRVENINGDEHKKRKIQSSIKYIRRGMTPSITYMIISQ